MDSNINTPIFIILDDGTVLFLHESWEVNCCGIEPIDVANGEYTSYDSEGQILKLITVNESGEIERPTENEINIPFLGKIIGITNDKSIRVIPVGKKNPKKLIEHLVRDLSGENDIEGLTLSELVAKYKEKHHKTIID